MSLKMLTEFADIVGKLKAVKRSGWLSQVGIERPESVADHSFRCAVLAMIISDLSNGNTEKLVRMMLLHDIQEAITGDFDSHAKKQLGIHKVRSQQKSAFRDILDILPPKLRSQYCSLWEEVQAQKTTEAILAYDIDKIEMVIQALEYEKEGYDSSKLDVFWENTESRIKTPLIRNLFNFLLSLREDEKL